MIAIADTCFIIDWSTYRRRDEIFKIFDLVLIPEQVLSEVISENTIAWISHALAMGKSHLYTPTPDILNEADSIVRASYSNPQMKKLEIPEALCIAVARRHGYVVLTENRGAYMFVEYFDEYREVKLWRALELLKELLKRRIITASHREDIEAIFIEYQEDTKHIFPRRDLEEAINEVSACIM